eukprot:m.455455 g.455455  ORF g.455455 m.455455 type:complete len:773 (+) comp20873_c0_seq1:207-2525(+)
MSWKEIRERVSEALALEDNLKNIVPNSFCFVGENNVIFLGADPAHPEAQTLMHISSETGTAQPLLPPDISVSRASRVISKEEELLRERRRLRTTGITTFTVHAPSNTILFLSGNELFSYQPFAAADNRPILVDDGSNGTCMDPKFCPSDPDLISFIRSNALCVARVSTGTCTVLAKGHGGLTIGTPPYIIQEEFDRYTGYWWRDDAYGGYAILYEEVDEVEIDRTPIVDFTRPSTCDDFPCPLAGSANAKVTLKLVEFPETIGDPTADAPGAPIIKVLRKPLNEPYPWAEYVVRCGWVADTSMCWVQLLDRCQQRLAFVIIRPGAFDDADNIVYQTVLEEYSDVWVNVSNILDFFPLHDTTVKFLWSSEHSGFRHIELVAYDLECVAPTKRLQLTSGEWVVDNVGVTVSCAADEVYLVGRRDTPTEAHLYRVVVRGLLNWIQGDPDVAVLHPSEPQRVTELGLYHEVIVSGDGKIMIDTKSSVSTPPVCEITFVDHAASIELCRHPDVPEYIVPELVHFTSMRHGHEIYGRVHRAVRRESDDRPAPTVLHVYGGPLVQFVTNKYGGGNLKASLWARMGFNVVSFDNCGSLNRGLAFEGLLKHRLGDSEIHDQVDGLEFLARSGRYGVSLDSVAVYGHSYGGYMALMALAKRPDVFRLALAAAPVTFWEAYDTAYTERYLGLPRSRPQAYSESSVVGLAPSFPDESNRLFLFHGLQDENVHFHNSAMLVDALIKEGKPYQLQVFPRDRHGIRTKHSSVHYMTALTVALREHLK